MIHKKMVGILLGLSILGIITGLIFTEPEKYGICAPDKLFTCIEPLGNSIGQPLFLGAIALSLVFLALLFLSPAYFKAWLKYAAWFIPVGIIIIASSDVNCSGGLGLGLCFDKELATWWSSGIYFLLSLGVIIATYIKQRKILVRH
jgi:hypothetical protein